MALPPADMVANKWMSNPHIINASRESIMSIENEIRKVLYERTDIRVTIPYDLSEIPGIDEESARALYLAMIIRHFEAKKYRIKFIKPKVTDNVIRALLSWTPEFGNKFIDSIKQTTKKYMK